MMEPVTEGLSDCIDAMREEWGCVKEEDEEIYRNEMMENDQLQGPLDVNPPIVSKVEQEDLNIGDQHQVKEEEIHVNIRKDNDKVAPSVLSESDQEEETNMRSPRGIKEEDIPGNISEESQTWE
ncbi:uncharacterized protein O3C94_015700 [Discoglossus pictus]